MEFTSFRAMSDATQPSPRPLSAAAGTLSSAAEPWVPPGKNKSHLVSRGLPSRREKDAAAVVEARSEAAAERSAVAASLDAAEDAFDRMEHTLDLVTADYEKLIVASTATSVLVSKRLQQLGLSSA